MASDVGQAILQFNQQRDPQRLRIKYAAMRQSAFSFLRGTCHLFYARLPAHALLRTAPAAWSCGDLHLENFGSYKGENRLAYFDINDFDEAALAPLTWDVLRFLSSVLVGAQEMALSPTDARSLCAAFLDAYGDTLASGKSTWIERATAMGLLRELFDNVMMRSRPDFLASRTIVTGQKRRIRIDGRKALAATPQERERVVQLLDQFARTQANPKFYKPLDVARRIAGTGSLGLERYIILVRGKGGPDANYLLDLKVALPSSLTPHLTIAQPKWKNEAERVIALQYRMQAVNIAFMHAIVAGRSSYVLRALLPSEDRVSLDRAADSYESIASVIRSMGTVVASAQLRSAGRDGSATADQLIAFAQKKQWKTTLLGLAERCAYRTGKDWQTYCRDYDKGLFASA